MRATGYAASGYASSPNASHTKPSFARSTLLCFKRPPLIRTFLFVLRKKTVLILGAGASKPFGFPTGFELSRIMNGALQNGAPGYNALLEMERYPGQAIDSFRVAFFYSGKNSVDAFLEHRPDFMEIGKAAIAAVLIPYESKAKLFAYEADNWLRYVFNNLGSSFDDFRMGAISFVTFNYDRTVEHFLFSSLQNAFNKTDDECSALLSEALPVVHLHGQLGSLPWQVKDGRGFAPHLDPATLRKGREGIKIIHEDIRDGRDKEFLRAKKLISGAQTILFMGFGYNKMNVERLGIRDLGKKALGTCIGMSNREKDYVVGISNNSIGLRDGDCLEFVRNHIAWG
jgi:hypothetical protein